jgi:ketosteroid isomerase-like protein
MPQESVTVVRQAFDAYHRRDEAAMLALTAPNVLVTQFPDQLDTRDYHGHAGIREVMAEWIGTWDDWTIELLDARDVSGDVLATARQRGRGKGSGVPMESEVKFVFTVRQGLIVRWRMFRTEAEALDAAGAEE